MIIHFNRWACNTQCRAYKRPLLMKSAIDFALHDSKTPHSIYLISYTATYNIACKQIIPALDEASRPDVPFKVSTTCLALELQIDGRLNSRCKLSNSFVGLIVFSLFHCRNGQRTGCSSILLDEIL